MQALRVPAARGVAWMTEGYRLLGKNPLVILLLVFAYLSLLVLSEGLHFLGSCVMAVLLPSFSVGLLVAFRHLDAGEPVALTARITGRKAYRRYAANPETPAAQTRIDYLLPTIAERWLA